jgi:radical SAM superfamily enzyme YgiQ (UPF0313 family)
MNSSDQLCIKLIHCGNRNIANPEDQLTKSSFYMPMGFFSMASELDREGFDVEIIHLDLEETQDIESILDFSSLDAVGLDCHWLNQGLIVMDTVRLIKRKKPGVFVFLGGFTASYFAAEIMKDYSIVDAVVRGDGETPVKELCRRLKENCRDDLAAVPNLAWRRESGEVVMNEVSYVAGSDEMNSFEFACMDLMRQWQSYRELCRYWSEFPEINRSAMFFLEIGRGCVYNCSFCGGSAEAQFCMNNRRGQAVRSIDAVISTIRKAVDFGYSFFYACFDFEASDEWYIRLFNRIKQEKLDIDLCYGCWRLPSPGLIDALSAACGRAVIEISPETANLDVRRKNKDPRLFYDNRQLEERLDNIERKGNLYVQLYFGYILPFETKETVFETIDYIAKLYAAYSHFAEPFYMNLSTDPASRVYLSPDDFGVDLDARTFGDYLVKLEEVYVVKKQAPRWLSLARPTGFTQAEAVDLGKRVEMFEQLRLFFPRSILNLVKRIDKPDLISAVLKETAVPTNREWSPARMKELLVHVFNMYHVEDSTVLKEIEKEFKRASIRYVQTGKNIKDRKLTLVTEAEKDNIRKQLHQAQDTIHAEFDF